MFAGSVICLASVIMLTSGTVFDEHTRSRPSPYNDSSKSSGKTPKVAAQVPLDSTLCPTTKCTCTINLDTSEPTINCNGKQLQEIPTFTSTDTVYYQIDFSYGNYIKSLPNNSFANLKVKKINLLNNQLTADIQPLAFAGTEQYLEELRIEGNGKIPIPFNRMVHLRNLKTLTVKHFRQDSPSENDYFQYFPYLQTLEMLKIDSLALNDNTFHGKLVNLNELVLDNVGISEIPVASLQKLTILQSLKITGNNRLESILGNSFEKLQKLKELQLSHNSLRQISQDAFSGITVSLTDLNLGSNYLQPVSLTSLSSKSWPNLEYLTLSYNTDLKAFPDYVFGQMPKLHYLYMVGLDIKTITRNLLSGLKNLHALDLGYNEIQTIADRAFLDNQNLGEIKIDYQFYGSSADLKLNINPASFTGLERSLTRLFLRETPLVYSNFWNTLKDLKALKELSLEKTKLDVIPNYAFAQNTKLWKLELHRNGISDLQPFVFEGLKDSLEDIWLESNNLSVISECVFKDFTKVTSIRLSKNPLRCDCGMVWLHRFLHKTMDNNEHFLADQYVCASPPNMANRILYNVTENTICQNYVPKVCPNIPNDQTTTKPDEHPVYSLKIDIASVTKNSITIAWTISGNSHVTSFKLEYHLTTDIHSTKTVYPHREQISMTINNLLPGNFYNVCLTAEINQKFDENGKVCKTTQTFSDSSDTNNQGGFPKDDTGENRNIIIGAIIAVVAVVVLVAVGVCAVVKYRYKAQKLQDIQFSLASPYNRTRNPHLQCGPDEMVVCTVPNEYMEINNAQLGKRYIVPSPRAMKRQMGVDVDDPYAMFYRVHKRRNPYENDDDEDECGIVNQGVDLNKSEEILCKPDLQGRHSAPSRLEPKELMKNDKEWNARPLPATPGNSLQVEKTKERSHTLQTKHGKNKDTHKRDLETNRKRGITNAKESGVIVDKDSKKILQLSEITQDEQK